MDLFFYQNVAVLHTRRQSTRTTSYRASGPCHPCYRPPRAPSFGPACIRHRVIRTSTWASLPRTGRPERGWGLRRLCLALPLPASKSILYSRKATQAWPL